MRITAILLAVLLAGACRTIPSEFEKPPEVYAEPPKPGTRLALAEFRVMGRFPHGQSAFHLLETGEEGLLWRLALFDHAEHTIDIFYYSWGSDVSGALCLDRVLQAADRGVRVRLLVDDLHIMGSGAGVASLTLHPNVDVRIFNPWRHRNAVAKGFEYIGSGSRLQWRSHNKMIVVDNRFVVIGGRNIGDQYFGLNGRFNFYDFDTVACGPIARRISEAYDHYWNSPYAYPGALIGKPTEERLAKGREELREVVRTAASLERFPRERNDWSGWLDGLTWRMRGGTAYSVYDRVPEEGVSVRLVTDLKGTPRSRRELLIASAYFIPDEEMMEELRAKVARGVRVVVLTNGLSSNDVPISNSQYKHWRKRLVEAGVELYELRPDAAVRSLAETPPVHGKWIGLHRKMIVQDRRHFFVGSLNLTPRAARINMENGVWVDDAPELAQQMAKMIERDIRPENAWRVGLDEEGKLYWENADRRVTSQPARGFGQRFVDWFFTLLPLEGQI